MRACWRSSGRGHSPNNACGSLPYTLKYLHLANAIVHFAKAGEFNRGGTVLSATPDHKMCTPLHNEVGAAVVMRALHQVRAAPENDGVE